LPAGFAVQAWHATTAESSFSLLLNGILSTKAIKGWQRPPMLRLSGACSQFRGGRGAGVAKAFTSRQQPSRKLYTHRQSGAADPVAQRRRQHLQAAPDSAAAAASSREQVRGAVPSSDGWQSLPTHPGSLSADPIRCAQGSSMAAAGAQQLQGEGLPQVAVVTTLGCPYCKKAKAALEASARLLVVVAWVVMGLGGWGEGTCGDAKLR